MKKQKQSELHCNPDQVTFESIVSKQTNKQTNKQTIPTSPLSWTLPTVLHLDLHLWLRSPKWLWFDWGTLHCATYHMRQKSRWLGCPHTLLRCWRHPHSQEQLLHQSNVEAIRSQTCRSSQTKDDTKCTMARTKCFAYVPPHTRTHHQTRGDQDTGTPTPSNTSETNKTMSFWHMENWKELLFRWLEVIDVIRNLFMQHPFSLNFTAL